MTDFYFGVLRRISLLRLIHCHKIAAGLTDSAFWKKIVRALGDFVGALGDFVGALGGTCHKV